MTPAIDPKWNAYYVMAITSTRKRCPNCNRMVKAGTPAVLRDERRQATGGATPWIGNRQSYTRGAWHLYHPECFATMVEHAESVTA